MFFHNLKRSVLNFVANESGASQVEYAFVAGLISLVMISGLVSSSDALADLFDLVAYETDPPPVVAEPMN